MSARGRTLAVAAAAAVGVACADVGDPQGPTSMAFAAQQLPAPFLVLRDTLRDTLGNAVPLRALVYDGNDNLLPDAPVEYAVLDTAKVVLRAGNYLVSTDTTALTVVRVQARSGALLSAPVPITIVRALPDTVVNADTGAQATGVMGFSNNVQAATTTRALRARVQRGTTPIGPYFVEFRIVSRPAFLDSAWFPTTASDTAVRGAAVVDTADASGIADRYVRARLKGGTTTATGDIVARAVIRQGPTRTDSVDFTVRVQVQP